MISLGPNENILMVIRRHWYALFRHTAIIFVLTVVLVLIYYYSGSFRVGTITLEIEYGLLLNFFLSLYALGIVLYALIVWADYYLDVWIITNQRLIDVEQHGLFSRTISELPMAKIQNVTLEIRGFFATILHFGNLKVETASRSTFVIRDAPHMYKAKEIILKYAHQSNGPPDYTRDKQ